MAVSTARGSRGVPLGLAGAMHLQFVIAVRGWVLLSSQGFAGTTLNALAGTTDGGRRWQLLQTFEAPPGQASVFEDVQAMAFQPSGFGIATVNSPATGSARVLTTTNGGETWAGTQLPLSAAAAETEAVEGAPSLSASGVAWVPVTIIEPSGHGEQLLLYSTADGGRHSTFRWPALLPLRTTLVLTGERLFVASGQGTAEYHIIPIPAGSPTWSHTATLSRPPSPRRHYPNCREPAKSAAIVGNGMPCGPASYPPRLRWWASLRSSGPQGGGPAHLVGTRFGD